jgi:hypothetical protein
VVEPLIDDGSIARAECYLQAIAARIDQLGTAHAVAGDAVPPNWIVYEPIVYLASRSKLSSCQRQGVAKLLQNEANDEIQYVEKYR